MSLQRLHNTPDGQRVMISQDVLDIAERIQTGDPTCLWSGDPRMFVQFNYRTEKYEVWRLGEDNVSRIISSWVPKDFDARVLKHLSEHDTRIHDVAARVDKHNEALEASRVQEIADLRKEMAKDVAWISKKLYLPGADAPRPRG